MPVAPDTPRVWVTGDLVTASALNTDIRAWALGITKDIWRPGVNGVNQAAGTTNYYGEPGVSVTEDNVVDIMPVARTLQNLRVYLNGSPGAGQSYTVTVRVNGADTAIGCVISDSATTGFDTTDTVTVAAGDRISIKVVTSGSANARQPHCAVELV